MLAIWYLNLKDRASKGRLSQQPCSNAVVSAKEKMTRIGIMTTKDNEHIKRSEQRDVNTSSSTTNNMGL